MNTRTRTPRPEAAYQVRKKRCGKRGIKRGTHRQRRKHYAAAHPAVKAERKGKHKPTR